MLVRRLTYILCALILIGVLGSAVSRRETQDQQATAPAPPPAAAADAAQVTADLPPEKVVHARVGDIINLSIRTQQPDTATIAEAGVEAVTSAQVPGLLQFVADQPGRFPIKLLDSNTTAGTLVVSGAG